MSKTLPWNDMVPWTSSTKPSTNDVYSTTDKLEKMRDVTEVDMEAEVDQATEVRMNNLQTLRLVCELPMGVGDSCSPRMKVSVELALDQIQELDSGNLEKETIMCLLQVELAELMNFAEERVDWAGLLVPDLLEANINLGDSLVNHQHLFHLFSLLKH